MKSNNRAFFKYFAFSLEVILLAVQIGRAHV